LRTRAPGARRTEAPAQRGLLTCLPGNSGRHT
jgi:hypothetical protein